MVDLTKIPFNDEYDFFDYLRLSHEHWTPIGLKKQWFFRGQANPLDKDGNEMWELKPTAQRRKRVIFQDYIYSKEESYLRELGISDKENILECADIAHTEFYLIDQFARLANDLGLSLPNFIGWCTYEHDFPLNYIKNIIDKKDSYKIWSHPIVALAQHHRIPTRLLDWTENPLVAAFFAMASYNDMCLEKRISTKNIVIYAVHESMFMKDTVKLTIPKELNPNLRHQEGIFFLDKESDNFYISNGKFRTFNDIFDGLSYDEISHILKRNPQETQKFEPYRRIELSIEPDKDGVMYFRTLKTLLRRENISFAHLMPNFDNVSKTTLDWVRLND